MLTVRTLAIALLCLLHGCFSPRYQEGIVCSEAMTCPPGMVCDPIENLCRVQISPEPECREDDDCSSKVCDELSGRCLEPSCGDGQTNGTETDIDCGGSCGACRDGQRCSLSRDCASRVCTDDSCAASRCGDGVAQPGEACDDGAESAGCDPDCTPAECGDGLVNEAAGELCDTSGADCCADTCDALLAQGTECRAAAGLCDMAETCTGASPACPADELAPASAECRPGSGACDPAEVCDGTSPDCPGSTTLPDGSRCDDCASRLCDSCVSGVCTDLCGNGTVDSGEECEAASDAACPGQCRSDCLCTVRRSCREYLALAPGTPSGIYRIDPDGSGSGDAPFEVYCDMVTDGGGWTRVFYEDTSGGSFFLSDEFELNKSNPAANLYAILNDLEKFRRNGEFELLMRWPGHAIFTADQQWAQTSNPVTDSPGAIPTGYRAISVPYTSNGWSSGLQRSFNTAHSLLDGTISPLGNWYYAVGTTFCWGSQSSGCQPAPSGGAHIAELLVR